MLLIVLSLVGCFGASETTAPEPAPVAAEPEPEPQRTLLTVSTDAGQLGILPVYHGTLRLTFGEVVAVVDPWTKAGLGDFEADYVFVTDVDPDRLDPDAIRRVSGERTRIVAPKAVADHETMAELTVAHVLANGDRETIGPFEVEAVPMYNVERGPDSGGVFHEKGRGNGYVLRMGGKAVYVAGDTECTDEVKALKGIDHAFLPMGPTTMSEEEAAACVRAFRPRAVTAYAYWGSDIEKFEGGLLVDEGLYELARADLYTTGAPF